MVLDGVSVRAKLGCQVLIHTRDLLLFCCPAPAAGRPGVEREFS